MSGLIAWWKLRKFTAASWVANFSYLWLAKTTYSGCQYWVYHKLQQKHKLLRIGPNELITGDPEIIRKINKERSGYDRGSWYTSGRFNPYHDNLLSVQQSAAHTKYKSRVTHAYMGREILDMEIGVNEQIVTLISILKNRYARHDRHLELGLFSCFFTMDVITRLAFGQEFGYLDNETDHHGFFKSLRDLWPRISTSADIPWIRRLLFSPLILKLFGPKPQDKTGFGALMGIAKHQVGKRFGSTAEHKQDMLGSFIHHGLTQEECEVEGLLMIIAGAESTASAIRSILVHTMTTPRVYTRLKTEINKAVENGFASSPISLDQAQNLPYLQAVIYEGIRMRAPVFALMPKMVPTGGDIFYGQYVPPDTAVCFNTAALLHSRELFGNDSGVFRPERFTDLASKERREMERNVELAFGSGQWQCVGKRVAFMELNKIIFEVFRNFDLQLVNPVKPCDVVSYAVMLESNMFVQVTETAPTIFAV